MLWPGFWGHRMGVFRPFHPPASAGAPNIAKNKELGVVFTKLAMSVLASERKEMSPPAHSQDLSAISRQA